MGSRDPDGMVTLSSLSSGDTLVLGRAWLLRLMARLGDSDVLVVTVGEVLAMEDGTKSLAVVDDPRQR